MKKAHHRIRRFCAILIGLVFLASGLLKLLDPVGTGLIVSEYFKFFHLGFLQGTAKALGMVLSLVEAATGAALVSGVFRKPTAVVTSVLVVFFTIITLILWIAKPDMDCGCFGEAIHLSHGQTLLKNVVLLALSAAAFLPFQNFGVPRKGKYVAFFLAIPSLVFALWHNARHLPMIDFTEFAPGAELFASLDNDYQEMDGKVPTFIYERNGQRGSFTLDALPDSTWTFVGVDTLSRSGMYKNASKPVLSFRDAEGEYQDELAVLGKVMVFSVYDPEDADWDRIRTQAAEARISGHSRRSRRGYPGGCLSGGLQAPDHAEPCQRRRNLLQRRGADRQMEPSRRARSGGTEGPARPRARGPLHRLHHRPPHQGAGLRALSARPAAPLIGC